MSETPDVEASGEALRAQSDTFVAQLDRLHELENAKRQLPPTDPRFLSLAVEVEDAARALLTDARDQTELGHAAAVAGVDDAIVEIPADLSAPHIIRGWRDAERQLAGADAASREARQLRLQIDAYRRAYQRSFAERLKDVGQS